MIRKLSLRKLVTKFVTTLELEGVSRIGTYNDKFPIYTALSSFGLTVANSC
jgi:hypothetical protein